MKDLNVSLLMDFYGNLLPEKQQDMLEQYYQEDLSLSEIADNSGITRQGVHDNIKRAVAELKNYEEKLGLLTRFSEITEAANEIRKYVTCNFSQEDTDKILSLLDIIIKEA